MAKGEMDEYKKSIGNTCFGKPYAEAMTKSKRYVFWDREEAFEKGKRTIVVGKTLRTEPPEEGLVKHEGRCQVHRNRV